VSLDRTPPLHPDAVSLAAGVDPASLLDRVDAGPGCSVKDSFADVDLAPFGFRVLFEAAWQRRPAPDPCPTTWSRLPDPYGSPDVAIVGDDDGRAVLNRSSDGVVGVTNQVGPQDGLAGAAAALFPGLPLVGYRLDGDGWELLGPLRVWVRG